MINLMGIDEEQVSHPFGGENRGTIGLMWPDDEVDMFVTYAMQVVINFSHDF